MFMIWCQRKDGKANGYWVGYACRDGGTRFNTKEGAQQYVDGYGSFSSLEFQIREIGDHGEQK